MLIDSLAPVVMVPLAVVMAPLLASLVGRFAPVPLVVSEVLLGLLIGPAVLAVTGIGVERGELTGSLAASMVGAGMVTELLFPVPGLVARRRSARAGAA